ncbi:MAG: helix-turn-helix domain-containing protein [Rhodospirillaceae bacterium]
MTGRSTLGEDDFAAVCRIPLFEGLAGKTVRLFTAEARVVDYDSRTLILSRGDVADRFFVVLAGRVRLFVPDLDGRESVIEFIDRGHSFAEGAMFGTCRVPVNAEAEAGSRLVHLPAKPVLALIAADAAVARSMMDSLARWQRHLIGRVGGFKGRTPGQRLAAELLALAATGSGAVTVGLAMTKAALASHIGITPESLSRAMARLRELGVSSHGHTVTIADVALLRRYCEDQDGQEG